MTREEAINQLEINKKDDTYVIDDEALDMAIKALQESSCEDAVSKASVFEIMGNLMSIPYDLDRPITEKDVSESMDEIRDLSPVTPTRKKGRKMDKIRFVQLTYTNGEKTYIKADTIVQLEEVGDVTDVFTIGNDSPLYVKESVDEILAKIGGEE